MEDAKIGTESEQMYLVTIARLSEMIDECPIPISKVAEVLDITPISANQMIHHLEHLGLLVYTPYKGVEFTDKGWQTGISLLRARRLWEVFLVEHLRYSPEEAEKRELYQLTDYIDPLNKMDLNQRFPIFGLVWLRELISNIKKDKKRKAELVELKGKLAVFTDKEV